MYYINKNAFLSPDYRMPFLRLSQDFDVVFIQEGEQVVIPCLGSVEDLNVTLYTVNLYV